jgi:hypothetical protein
MVDQKILDILVLKMGLLKPTVLTTLYLIFGLFFKSEDILIEEDLAEIIAFLCFWDPKLLIIML